MHFIVILCLKMEAFKSIKENERGVEMRYFKFIRDLEFKNRVYKKDEEYVINFDNEVLDNNGEWMFDSDSLLSLANGIIIKR